MGDNFVRTLKTYVSNLSFLFVASSPLFLFSCLLFNAHHFIHCTGTIENRELDAELFRASLRSAMNLQLSKEEFDTLMPHWDNGGYVNGCDFILLFYRIRFEYRSKLLKERIAKEKAYREKDAAFMEERRKEIAGKTVTRVSYNFTEKEKVSVRTCTSVSMDAGVDIQHVVCGGSTQC